MEAECTTCGGHQIYVIEVGEHAEARKCACVAACRECRGSGWTSSGAVRTGTYRDRLAPVRRCACTTVDRKVACYTAAKIPARQAECELGNLDGGEGPLSDVMVEASAWMRAFASEKPNRGFLLYGGVGVGKTHLMVAMLRHLAFLGPTTIRFVEFSHLLARLRAGYASDAPQPDLIEPLISCDVLGLDELGKGRANDFELSVIDEIISRRHNAKRPIIATTNYRPAELLDRVGERVHSRLMEMCTIREVKGADYRKRPDNATAKPGRSVMRPATPTPFDSPRPAGEEPVEELTPRAQALRARMRREWGNE